MLSLCTSFDAADDDTTPYLWYRSIKGVQCEHQSRGRWHGKKSTCVGICPANDDTSKQSSWEPLFRRRTMARPPLWGALNTGYMEYDWNRPQYCDNINIAIDFGNRIYRKLRLRNMPKRDIRARDSVFHKNVSDGYIRESNTVPRCSCISVCLLYGDGAIKNS